MIVELINETLQDDPNPQSAHVRRKTWWPPWNRILAGAVAWMIISTTNSGTSSITVESPFGC
jgi:hypothetical protein